MKTVVIFFAILCLVSCQSSSYKERNSGEFFQAAGGLNFLMAETPEWANAVSDVACFRDKKLHLLNLAKLKAEFNLTLRQSLNAQFYYNQELKKVRERMNSDVAMIPLRELDLSFFKALESAKAAVDPLRLPDFNRIHLTVLEEWLTLADGENKLKEFLQSPLQNEGVPVVISLCRSQAELENKFQEFGAFSIGAEWAMPFHEDLKSKAGWSLALQAFFKPQQSLTLFKANKNIKWDYSKLIMGKYTIK